MGLSLRTACAAGLLFVACTGAVRPDGADADARAGGHDDDPRFVELRNEAFRRFDAWQQQGGDGEGALSALLAAHEHRPGAYGVNERLGRLYADRKRLHDARHHFQLALQADPDAAEARHALACVLAELGRNDEVLALLPPLLHDERLRGDALFLQAAALDERGERERAQEVLSGAGDLPPERCWRARALAGRQALQEGELAEARAHFEAALDGRPDAREALKGLADTCRRLGDEQQARHWDEVLALLLALTDNEFVRQQRRGAGSREQLAGTLRSAWIDEQIAQRRQRLQRLVVLHPAWADGFRQLAEAQLADGDAAAACATVGQFLQRHGETLEPALAAELRERYCGDGA